MTRIILALTIILFTASSCQKNQWEERLTDRIEGHWKYEKAKYQAKTFSREDRLDDFKNDNIYFHKDGTLEIINSVDNTYLEGIYSFERNTNINNWDMDDDNNTTSITYQVHISLKDTSANSIYQELWDQFSITRKVIRYQLEEDGRPFFFKLCKQEN